jgi:hypothetical protein
MPRRRGDAEGGEDARDIGALAAQRAPAALQAVAAIEQQRALARLRARRGDERGEMRDAAERADPRGEIREALLAERMRGRAGLAKLRGRELRVQVGDVQQRNGAARRNGDALLGRRGLRRAGGEQQPEGAAADQAESLSSAESRRSWPASFVQTNSTRPGRSARNGKAM